MPIITTSGRWVRGTVSLDEILSGLALMNPPFASSWVWAFNDELRTLVVSTLKHDDNGCQTRG
jgi:hypothetical protein